MIIIIIYQGCKLKVNIQISILSYKQATVSS